FVDLTGFDVTSDIFDTLDRQIGGILVDGSDVDAAVIFDVDAGAGFLGNAANRGAALADDVANFFRIDLDGEDTRRPLRDLFTWLGDRLVHRTQNMQTTFMRLIERGFHDLASDAGNLDIHLQR